MDPIIGGAIGGAIGGLTNLFNAGQQYRNQKKLMAQQHQYNLETMAQQNQYNVENWQMNNEYNDPAAVAARYQAAGMDVNQAFGGSSHYTPSQQSSAASAVGTGSPTAPLVSSLDPLGALDQALKIAQIENVKADTGKKESETGDQGQFIRGQALENDRKELLNSLSDLDIDLKRLELARGNFDLQFLTDTRSINIALLNQNYDNLLAEYGRILADKDLKEEQRNKVLADIAVAKVQVSAIEAGTALSLKEVDAYKYKVRELVTATDANAALRKLNVSGADLNRAKELLVRLQAVEQSLRNEWIPAQERAKLINSYADSVHSLLSLIPGIG